MAHPAEADPSHVQTDALGNKLPAGTSHNGGPRADGSDDKNK